MYNYTDEQLASIKKVEATRSERLNNLFPVSRFLIQQFFSVNFMYHLNGLILSLNLIFKLRLLSFR